MAKVGRYLKQMGRFDCQDKGQVESRMTLFMFLHWKYLPSLYMVILIHENNEYIC